MSYKSPLCKLIQNIDVEIKLEILVHVSATEMEISGSVHEKKNNDFACLALLNRLIFYTSQPHFHLHQIKYCANPD